MLSLDANGHFWQHVYVPYAEHTESLQNMTGLDINSAIAEHFRERVSALLEAEPTEVSQHEQGTYMKFALPPDIVALESPGAQPRLPNGYSMMDMTKAGRTYLYDKDLFSHNFVVMLHDAKVDVIRKNINLLELHTLSEVSEMLINNAPHIQTPLSITKLITQYPEIEEVLRDKLASFGIEAQHFHLAGTGATGVFLVPDGTDIVIAIRGDTIASEERTYEEALVRQPIPQHLQPLYETTYQDLDIEITPRLQPTLEMKEIQHLIDSIATTPHLENNKIWNFMDTGVRNIGMSAQGTAYVLDGNAITVKERDMDTPSIHINGHQDWVNSDGTWKQYQEFEYLHEAFNSPLHQAGGTLSLVREESSILVQDDTKPINIPVSWRDKVRLDVRDRQIDI
jgi:hypothetical protein